MTLSRLYRIFRKHLVALGIVGTILVALNLLTIWYRPWAELPLPWFLRAREALEIVGVAYWLIALAFVSAFALVAYLVAPPGAVTVDQLQFIPESPFPEFRYRLVTSERELQAVVRISDNEFGVVVRHPTLFGERRYAMYKRWWQLQPHAFMILDRFDEHEGCWLPFALTIILPLTEAGKDFIVTGEMRLIKFGEPHIARGTSKHLLIEAWIMRKRNPLIALRNPIFRPPEEEHAKALLFAHLGLFHTGDVTDSVSIFIDTSTYRMTKISARLGFIGNYKSRDGAPFKQLSLPHSTGNTHLEAMHHLLYAHVRKAREWKVFRETTTEPAKP